MKRLIANIIALVSLLVLPFWCTVIVVLVLSVLFDYIEIIPLGAFYDVLYANPDSFLEAHTFMIYGILLYGIMFRVKPYIKL